MIHLSNITLRHGPEPLLEDASATIHPGQKVGLVGANGSGKSSLFSLLLGEMSVDQGEASLPDDWTIGYMAQEIDDLDRPAIEYVIDGDQRLREAEAMLEASEANGNGHAIAEAHAQLDEAGSYTARSRAGSLLNGLGFASEAHEKPVGSFSGGWRIRLSLARALMTPSDLLLLDEPTNHLDMETVVWLESWLRRFEGTLVVISHDRDFLDNVVDRIVHIEHRQLNTYTGGYSDFEQQRAERLSQQQATFEKQQRQIAHMQKFVDRFRAQANKARAAQSRLKAIERMEKVAPAHADSPFDFVFPEPPRASNPLVHLDEVRLGYGETVILDGISTSLAPGDRVGLLGLNGAGKSTFVRALAGELEPMAGQITRTRNLRIGYFAQHQLEQLDSAASPVTHLQRIAPDEREQKLRDFLGGFDFRGDMATAPVGPFSGGEKARLVLALLVWQAPNLLLLDEPTNHLDLDMRHALTVAMQGFEGAVVTVSHDRHLLRNTVDDYWLVADGGVRRFKGDLDDYRRWLAERSSATDGLASSSPENPTPHTAGARKARRRDQAARRARIKPLQNRVDKLDRQLEKTNRALVDIESELADSGLYEEEQADRLQQLLARQAELRQTLESIESEWMEAAEALEAERATD
ncbi:MULTISPECIES: ATP-binding cassette domain-containing protein [unclassified Wenzhouxiangella]|uniref:ATP-binding cassette domain-containing protein n=1 Tax=unclassified Wenzhouxiangella TaxID=2613841 RepID=UPI000E32C349|nr:MULTISPECIES: ATP-binding cassette domain-containing protein [unclassified Wenzhouxiangella]RFF28489.1 ATP-binding cassette domain-containing protein [Wenzhouxiangella sp. 15181]RFP70007.1 ATP-binding cassette domain-containing protein [Wenzhouxiangella sp. 15190]